MERRAFVKCGFTLMAVPVVDACKRITSNSGLLETASMTTTSTSLVHNSRYDDLPLHASTLRLTNNFEDDTMLIKAHVEDVLTRGKFPAFRVRGGGHSYIGASVAQDGYVLNMQPFNRVEVKADQGVVRVGAGSTFLQVLPQLAAAGSDLFLATGDCPTVGVTGYHTGGGQSLLSPALGLGVDRVASATIIVFKRVGDEFQGQVYTISPSLNPDLFWACMGGGGQFGVITDLSLRYTQLPAWSAYTLKARHDTSSTAFRSFVRDWMSVCASELDPTTSSKLQVNKQGDCGLVGVAKDASGDYDKLQKLAGRHSGTTTKELMTADHMAVTFSGCRSLAECSTTAWTISPLYQAAKSTFLPPGWTISDQNADQLSSLIMGNTVADTAYIQFSRWSGANQATNNAVSFPFRNYSYECQVMAAVTSKDKWKQTDSFDKWVDDVTQCLGERKAAFYNHVNAEIAKTPELYFADSWARLKEVKAKYDPDNIFDALTPAAKS